MNWTRDPDTSLSVSGAFVLPFVEGAEMRLLSRPIRFNQGARAVRNVEVLFALSLVVFTNGASLSVAQSEVHVAPEIVLQSGHSQAAYQVAFSSDGQLLASGGSDGNTLLWEVATGRELRVLANRNTGVTALAFSPDGHWLAAGGQDGTAKIWAVETGRDRHTLSGHKYSVNAVAFSSDGSQLFSGSTDAAKVWEVATGRELRNLPMSGRGHIAGVAISSNGGWFAAGDAVDQNVRLLPANDGQAIRTLSGQIGSVTGLAFSPDASILASSSHEIKLWDVVSGKEIRTLAGHSLSVSALAFSPNGRLLASGSEDHSVKLWDAATGLELKTFTGYDRQVFGVAFSPDSRLLASASGNSTIKIWEVNTGREFRTLAGRVSPFSAVAISPNGRWLASASEDASVRLWDVEAGRQAHHLTGHANAVGALAFSPNGRWLASGSDDSTARVWEVETGKELFTLWGHTARVTAVIFSSDSRFLASTSQMNRDGELILWDMSNGQAVHTFHAEESPPFALAFSPDGHTVATGHDSNTVVLWDAATGSNVRLQGDRDHPIADAPYPQVNSVAFSPDGRFLAAAGRDNVVRLWDVPARRQIWAGTGHERSVKRLAFSPDGRFVASCGWDTTARLWDVATGQEVHTLRGHTAAVMVATFSPDGRRLVTGGEDRTIKLWDVNSGALVANLSGHDGDILGLAFTPDGRRLVSASADGSTRVWDGSTNQELALLTAMRGTSDWAIVTPTGLFDGSSAGTQELVAWRIGGHTYPPDRFFADFYTPGLLARLFTGEHPTPQIDLASLKLPPEVHLNTPGAGASTPQQRITVEVEAVDQGGGIAEIRLYQNGKLVGARPAPSGPRFQHAFEVDLVSGENVLKAVAFSRDRVQGNEDSAHLVFEEAALKKPDLHLLAVGINQYEDPKLNLDFAQPDAQSLAEFFQKQGRLFNSADVITLFNKDATGPNIRQALEQLAERTRREDVVIVYLAGHGVGLGEQFYFLPHEMHAEMDDEAAIRKYGIPATVLGDALLGMKALKQILILDTCESEGALPLLAKAVMFRTRGLGSGEEKAMKMLARSEGVYLIAASTRQQYAYEVPELGHGVLTYALLSGLGEKGPPQASAMTDGIITVYSLLQYVNQIVPDLTEKYHNGAKQYPVSSNTGQDFPLWLP